MGPKNPVLKKNQIFTKMLLYNVHRDIRDTCKLSNVTLARNEDTAQSGIDVDF